MSAVDALGTSAQTASVTPNAFSALSSESFVKIMFTELSHQDPTQPNDSKALLEQLSSLRTIQSSIDMSSRLGSLVAQNELASASSLIGKKVTGLTDDFKRVTGLVSSVSRTADGATLNLDSGVSIKMSNMDQVLGASTGTAS